MNDPEGFAPGTVVVIGFGSCLRGDDAVGQQIANEVGSWGMPNVRALAVHQLMPELAGAIADAGMVIFVDACAEEQAGRVQMRRLGPAGFGHGIGHTDDPRTLLGLAEAVFGRSPCAWLVTVPAARFDFGRELSPEAQRGAAAALDCIRCFLVERTQMEGAGR